MNKIWKNRKSLFCILGIAVLLCAFVYRMKRTLGVNDDAFNIAIAYSLALGKKPLIESWDLFQMGNMFLTPFIWIFVKIKGNTDGIMLYCRYVYMFVNILLAVLIYFSFKRFLGKLNSVLLGLVVVTFAPFAMYNLFYDTCLILFMMAGISFWFLGLYAKTNKGRNIALLFAGVFHAFMCFAYQTSALIYPFMLIAFTIICIKKYKNFKEWIVPVLFYILGSLIIFIIFVDYCLSNGLSNIFLFDSKAMNTGMSSRKGMFNMKSVIRSAQNTVKEIYSFNKISIPTSVLLIVLLFIGKFRKNDLIKKIAVAGMLIVPLICAYISKHYIADSSHYSIIYFGDLLIFAPFLYFCIDEKDKQAAREMLWLLWFPSVLCCIIVFYTALAAGVITLLGTYCGAICTIMYIIMISRRLTVRVLDENAWLALILTMFVSFANIYIYNMCTFQYATAKKCVNKFETGIFKGLYGSSDVKFYNRVESTIKGQLKGTDKTVVMDEKMIYAYLYTDKIPWTSSLWRPFTNGKNWSSSIYYWDKLKRKPDVIILWSNNINAKLTTVIKPVLDTNYTKDYADDLITLYRKRK